MTSILRQRMLDAMVLSGKAARTQAAYIGAVFGLARHYHRSPDALSADEVQHYLLYLLRERHLSRSSVNQYGCAFRFLNGRVLGLDGQTFQIPLAPAPQCLPEILSRSEIAALLEHAPHTKARTLLCCAYALGLRVSELCALRPEHIDSAADRRCVRVVQGKGARDRYVPLSEELLALLRDYWRVARPQAWLFPAARDASRAIDCKSAQRWYDLARDGAGITKRGGIHTLRCYATHLLEAGIDPAQPVAVAGPRLPQHHHALPAPGAPRPARRRAPHAAGLAGRAARASHAALRRGPVGQFTVGAAMSATLAEVLRHFGPASCASTR